MAFRQIVNGAAVDKGATTATDVAGLVNSAVSQIVDAAPAALDTLNELAAALGDDASFASTVTNAIATKANIAGPTFTGTTTIATGSVTGNLTVGGDLRDTGWTASRALTTDASGNAVTSSVTSTEVGYLSGVTSAIQTQINGKANTSHTHAISDVTSLQTSLDAKAPLANPTFTGTVSGITKSMVGLGNVDNTSDANKPISTATQTALDGKAAVSHSHNANAITYTIEDKSANYTIVAADEGKVIRSTGAAITVTVADVFAIGEVVTFTQYGAGQITFTPAGGVTLHSVDSKRKTNKQYSTVQIMKTAAATYLLFGDIAA